MNRASASDPKSARGDDEKFAAKRERVRTQFWGKARRLAGKLPFSEDLVAAYYCAFDRQTPRHVQITLIGALAYFILPFDAVPDLLPLIGFGDDALTLAAALRLVASHIKPEHRDAARKALEKGATAQDVSPH